MEKEWPQFAKVSERRLVCCEVTAPQWRSVDTHNIISSLTQRIMRFMTQQVFQAKDQATFQECEAAKSQRR